MIDHLKKIYFVLLFGIILSLSGLSQQYGVFFLDSLHSTVRLDTLWKFIPDDDTLYANPDYDDSHWDELTSSFSMVSTTDSVFPGYGWFRLHLVIDSSLRNKQFAFTISQQGASQLYLDGILLEESGVFSMDPEEEVTDNPKTTPIVSSFTDSLTYVIAVRYSNLKARSNLDNYRSSNAGFIIRIKDPKVAMENVQETVIAAYFILFLFSIFIVLSFVHMLLFLFYRKQRSNLYYSIFMFLFSGVVFNVFLSNVLTETPDFRIVYDFITSLLFPFFFLPLTVFLYTLFLKKIPKIFWVIIGIGVIISVLYYLNVGNIPVLYMGYILLLWIETTRVIIRAMLKKFDGAWIIGIGVLFFILFFTLIIIIAATFGNINVDGSSPYALLFMISLLLAIVSIPLSMSVYLARDFSRTNMNLEKQLEQVKILSAKSLEQEREKKKILEGQKEKLEVQVKERTKELAAEQEKTEELLLNTLPLKVVNDLKLNGKTEPESFEDVTVYFSDIVGFTNISSQLEPKMLIEELNTIFTGFDDIMEKNGCERIKTIGDAYLAVCGMPERKEDHAVHMLQAAIEIKEYLEKRNESSSIQWIVRIGIHSGKVVGGIVGVKKYIYDVFGDTINTTSRMESNSEPMRINVSETTYMLAKDQFTFFARKPMVIKGKGKMKMYFLES